MENPLSLEVLTQIFRINQNNPSRIVNREGTTIEFKESYNHCNRAQYMKTIAAFANNRGGYIIFGVGDKPRCLIGLNDKSLSQFEDLKVEEFTKTMLDYFSPEIKWEHCTFEFRGMSFGVIYIHPLIRKPCICKKQYDNQNDKQNEKYSLREGDIYYRYGGRSQRIRYEELASIIDETRNNEEKQWINLIKKVAHIGIENAALLDMGAGNLSGSSGSVVIDGELLQKLAFIKEGSFVETGGTPTLRLIGDITEISPGKVVVKETSKKVVRAIEPSDIFRAFLKSEQVDEPIEYIKRICSELTANYPVYFFIRQAGITTSDAISIVSRTTNRAQGKSKLIERLEGKYINQNELPKTTTHPGKQKETYRQKWLTESISIPIENIGYCIDALLSLSSEEILEHEKFIRATLLGIYNSEFENTKCSNATKIRKAICRVDECLFLEDQA